MTADCDEKDQSVFPLKIGQLDFLVVCEDVSSVIGRSLQL